MERKENALFEDLQSRNEIRALNFKETILLFIQTLYLACIGTLTVKKFMYIFAGESILKRKDFAAQEQFCSLRSSPYFVHVRAMLFKKANRKSFNSF